MIVRRSLFFCFALLLISESTAAQNKDTALCLNGYAWREMSVIERTVYVRGLLDAFAWEDGQFARRCADAHCDLAAVIEDVEVLYKLRPAYRIVPVRAVLNVAIDHLQGSKSEADIAGVMDGLVDFSHQMEAKLRGRKN